MIPIFTSVSNRAITILVPEKDLAIFKELIRRATNTWDSAPPEIKEFADMLIHGEPLQDYFVHARPG